MSQFLDNLFVFTITGLSAVAIKYLGHLDRSFWAGIVAMIPVKTLVAFAILYGQSGSAGIRAAMPGLWAGAFALVLMLASMAWALHHLRPGVAIALSMAVWIAAVFAFRAISGEAPSV